MTAFYKGKEDEVWQTALEIEKKRQKQKVTQRKKRRKRNFKGEKTERTSLKDDVKRRSDRAKLLTNDGELSKLFATMVQRGLAPPTQHIISQLKTKFSLRSNEVKWPNKERIDELRSIFEKTGR